jgi:hypothetical protein
MSTRKAVTRLSTTVHHKGGSKVRADESAKLFCSRLAASSKTNKTKVFFIGLQHAIVPADYW